MRLLIAPVKKDASCGDSDYGDGAGVDEGASDCSTSSSSIMPPVTSFDRHLVLIGCQSFQAFFDRSPEILSHFDKFNAIEIDGVLVSSALKMHSSRVLAIVEDMVENTGNPEKIRTILQDLGRNHYRQVCKTDIDVFLIFMNDRLVACKQVLYNLIGLKEVHY